MSDEARYSRLKIRWDIDWDYWEAQIDGFVEQTVISHSHGSSGMTVESKVGEMIGILQDTVRDAGKHDRGNAAAGRRVRKALQAVKILAQEARVKVQADKASR